MPYPSFSNSASSKGESSRSVKPAAWRVGQKRLPGRAKWCRTAPEYSPGLMPQKRTRSPGAITSGTFLSWAAVICARVGLQTLDMCFLRLNSIDSVRRTKQSLTTPRCIVFHPGGRLMSATKESPAVANGIHDLTTDVADSAFYMHVMAPTTLAQRKWGLKDIAALWISMSACVTTYTLASSLIAGGMNWWQAVLTIFLGNVIVLIPMVLNAHAGTKYGIP